MSHKQTTNQGCLPLGHEWRQGLLTGHAETGNHHALLEHLIPANISALSSDTSKPLLH